MNFKMCMFTASSAARQMFVHSPWGSCLARSISDRWSYYMIFQKFALVQYQSNHNLELLERALSRNIASQYTQDMYSRYWMHLPQTVRWSWSLTEPNVSERGSESVVSTKWNYSIYVYYMLQQFRSSLNINYIPIGIYVCCLCTV